MTVRFANDVSKVLQTDYEVNLTELVFSYGDLSATVSDCDALTFSLDYETLGNQSDITVMMAKNGSFAALAMEKAENKTIVVPYTVKDDFGMSLNLSFNATVRYLREPWRVQVFQECEANVGDVFTCQIDRGRYTTEDIQNLTVSLMTYN